MRNSSQEGDVEEENELVIYKVIPPQPSHKATARLEGCQQLRMLRTAAAQTPAVNLVLGAKGL